MKRLVVCLDGTWKSDKDPELTNVVKIRDAILREGTDVPQLCHYDAGPGASDSMRDRMLGGVFGNGLGQNVREAYAWLCKHYEPGDQIFLFGFSRGAYTARSVSGMLRTCGVVRGANESVLDEAWRVYRKRDPKLKADKPAAVEFRRKHEALEVDVHFIGVWDTVGAHGIPVGRFVRLISFWRHGFHDTGLSSRVKHAYHALAIDEGRYSFEPTLWKHVPEIDKGQKLEQVWFPGAHGDVGGGYKSAGLSDCALAWMAGKAREAGLKLKDDIMTCGNNAAPAEDTRYLRFLPGNLRDVARHPEWGESVSPHCDQRYANATLIPRWKPRNFEDWRTRQTTGSTKFRRPLLVALLRTLLGSNVTARR